MNLRRYTPEPTTTRAGITTPQPTHGSAATAGGVPIAPYSLPKQTTNTQRTTRTEDLLVRKSGTVVHMNACVIQKTVFFDFEGCPDIYLTWLCPGRW